MTHASTPSKRKRASSLLWLAVVGVALGTLALSACIIGPKHDDPLAADLPPGDTGIASADTRGVDTYVPSPDDAPGADAAGDGGGGADTSPDGADDRCGDGGGDGGDASDATGCGDASDAVVADGETAG